MMIFLNLVHIVAGAFWAGSALLLTFFVMPAVSAAGQPGATVIQKLTQETRFPLFMALGGALTVLSGLVMYWLVSGGLSSAWLSSAHGIAITVGAVAGICGAITGGAVAGRASKRLDGLMAECQAAGKPPTAEQQAVIERMQATMRKGSLASSLFILIALMGMALARTL
jgi:hypothetical protein